ncbi:polysaccharide pyruvyl transferase WcaK-like protein [Kribbella pratensis]|uniref:Polysaccharide pyruvyl transferase WcaK-like protein n=1 Tax=Kribbella pratensis TaxID=2512112 RepID=A0ABY2FNS4_9ACTN|nr:polysaccharide pyruvyl transferase family protein [Kribbella pratensis]TDW94240.1 polysaccharide pyruvyl transferase WcaK-like protein [Kribbella pratensis]
MTSARRIGLFGRLGSGNLGNDATLEAVLAYLRAEYPDAVVDSMCSGPEALTARYGIPAVQLHWLHDKQAPQSRLARAVLTVPRIALGALVDTWRTAGWVTRHDVVIVPGMGVLESTVPQRPWQLPYSLAVLSIAGRLSGTKVAFVSVGATVVRQRVTRVLLRIGARLAHYRSFRDEESLDAARRTGLASTRDRVYPDLVFALPAPAAAPGPTGIIGVGVMAYYGSADDRARSDELHTTYLDKMRRLVGRLVASGYQVQLFVGDEADEPVVPELLAEAGPGNARYDRCDTFDELIHQVAGVDVMVGTRFHNVIAALKCGTPTIAIGYGRKHDAVMRLLGQGEYVHDIRDFDVDRLIEQLTVLTHDRERIVGELAERNSELKRALEDQFSALSAEVFARPPARVGSVPT